MISICKASPIQKNRVVCRANTLHSRCYFAIVFCLLLSALSAPPQATQAAGETTTIVIQGAGVPPGFSPSLLTIHVYDTVVFVNRSSPAASYAINARDSSFSSPAIAPNQQWKVTFNSVGVHEFRATTAPQRMIGEILVVDNTVSLLPTFVPSVNATVIALIQSGHAPPDTIEVATPHSAPTAKQATKRSPTTTIPVYIMIALTVIAMFLLAGLAYLFLQLRGFLVRRRRRDVSEHEDKEDMLLSEIMLPTRMGKEKKFAPEPAAHISGKPPLLRLRRVQLVTDEDDEDE